MRIWVPSRTLHFPTSNRCSGMLSDSPQLSPRTHKKPRRVPAQRLSQDCPAGPHKTKTEAPKSQNCCSLSYAGCQCHTTGDEKNQEESHNRVPRRSQGQIQHPNVTVCPRAKRGLRMTVELSRAQESVAVEMHVIPFFV